MNQDFETDHIASKQRNQILFLLGKAAAYAEQSHSSSQLALSTVEEIYSLLSAPLAEGDIPDVRQSGDGFEGLKNFDTFLRHSDSFTTTITDARRVQELPWFRDFRVLFDYIRTTWWREIWTGRPGDLRDFGGRTLRAFHIHLGDQKEMAHDATGEYLVNTKRLIPFMPLDAWSDDRFTFMQFFAHIYSKGLGASDIVWDVFRGPASFYDPTFQLFRTAESASDLNMNDLLVTSRPNVKAAVLQGLQGIQGDFARDWERFLSDPYQTVGGINADLFPTGKPDPCKS